MLSEMSLTIWGMSFHIFFGTEFNLKRIKKAYEDPPSFTVPMVQRNSYRWRFEATDLCSSTMLRLKRVFFIANGEGPLAHGESGDHFHH